MIGVILMQESIDLRVEVDPGDTVTGKLCSKGRGGGGRWMKGMIRVPEFGRPRTQKNGEGVFQGNKMLWVPEASRKYWLGNKPSHWFRNLPLC